MAAYVGAAPAFGVHPGVAGMVISIALVAVLGAISAAFVMRKLPCRWAHLGSTLSWWCPMGSTLVLLHETQNIDLAWILVLLLASAGVMLDTRLVIATLIVALGISIPLVVQAAPGRVTIIIVVLVTAAIFAGIIHALMRAALVKVEAHRLAEKELQDRLLHSQRIEVAGTLAAGLAHDMNNVLASISMFAELAREHLPPDAAVREDVQQIVTQAARGAELTRSLLAFSRRGQYRKQAVSVRQVITDAQKLFSRTLPKGVALRVSPVPEVCVEGDPAQLAQVLINLAVNAADAMDGTGTLSIDADVAGDRVRVRVTDTGKGMDEATRQRVFEPFFTTKPMGKGTGLGLATVWGIVQNHGGTVDVESRPGAGATFSFSLPVTAGTVARHKVDTTPVLSASRDLRVLVVDDEPAVRAATQRLLSRAGFDVVTAANGLEALSTFEAESPIGLVILDMGMPVMGGAECFAKLREKSDVPVIVATGYAVDKETQAMMARGAALIEKPYRSADFVREVRKVLAAAGPGRACEAAS